MGEYEIAQTLALPNGRHHKDYTLLSNLLQRKAQKVTNTRRLRYMSMATSLKVTENVRSSNNKWYERNPSEL